MSRKSRQVATRLLALMMAVLIAVPWSVLPVKAEEGTPVETSTEPTIESADTDLTEESTDQEIENADTEEAIEDVDTEPEEGGTDASTDNVLTDPIEMEKVETGSILEIPDMPLEKVLTDPMEIDTVEVDPILASGDITIESVATGKLLKTYRDENTPLTVDGNSGDEGTVFSSAFGSYTNGDLGSITYTVAQFISKDYNNGLKSAVWGSADNLVKVYAGTAAGGWESIVIVPIGDGKVAFQDSRYKKFITVNDQNQLEGRLVDDKTKETLTDKEKFIIHCDVQPGTVTNLKIDDEGITTSSLVISWDNPWSIYTGLELYQKDPDGGNFTKIADLTDESSYKVTGLQRETEYTFKLRAVNGTGSSAIYSDYSAEISGTTRGIMKPEAPENVTLEQSGDKYIVSWDTVEGGTNYIVQRAVSMFADYEDVVTIKADDISATASAVTESSITESDTLLDVISETKYDLSVGATAGMALDTLVDEMVATMSDSLIGVTADAGSGRMSVEVTLEGNKYANYFKVVAVNSKDPDDLSGAEYSDQSDYVSLEKNMFGNHTLIFAPTDATEKIDETLKELFDKQNDRNADAQFKGEQWQVYFKPGDYTDTKCMYLGFYTSFNGLGKTPYDVKLNNIAIPAYLDDMNATCNFWRSTENLSVINTGNEAGKAEYGSWSPELFNWGVAQAAPLRRVYTTRQIKYDWNWGWASGGYVADCFIDVAGNEAAGTPGGQQFYTRNTKVTGNVYGTTLNNFFQGVEASNMLNAQNADALKSGEGYSNWGIPAADGGQQVFTCIENTEKIAEKPFLYLDDDGEYKVFVPAVQENRKGISWSKDNMGQGTSLMLSDFYIAYPEDSAATINAKIAEGKHIYFTPGIYHAEVPIQVNRAGTILLGTGMSSIIPDNSEAAMKIGDVDGVRVEGLIFDAGKSSAYLLVVGEEGKHTDHSNNPVILQDLFFRIGGTTDKLTKADNALIINSDDTIGDHFWIWRADHGAGVEWYGNESQHGLIVNGDDVTCYALFNEHFQSYHTLWNGDNGATYFYQNETCYDPITQKVWMSHDGTVNGYSSYKVSNKVDNHYAVGLGIYNVFIYTGASYDSTKVQIQLDNAIEVPNKPGVLVENACLQTFAKDDGALQKINHIVNGVGGSVSSGIDAETGEIGEGWSRKYLLYYNDGKAAYGKETTSDSEKGKNIGIVEEEEIPQPMNEPGDIDFTALQSLYSKCSNIKKDDYTAESYAALQEALEEARIQLMDKGEKWAVQKDVDAAHEKLKAAEKNLVAGAWFFTDVPVVNGWWTYEAVKYVYNHGIMNGIAGTTRFDPNGKLNRAMFATILHRMAGTPSVTFTEKFTDVSDGKYYSEAIIWANKEGIVVGFSDGSYGVTTNITREQIAKMLYQYAVYQGYDVSGAASLDNYTDKDSVSSWAVDYVKWAVDAGMITAKPGDGGSYRIDPKGEATRAECSKMIQKFMEKYQ